MKKIFFLSLAATGCSALLFVVICFILPGGLLKGFSGFDLPDNATAEDWKQSYKLLKQVLSASHDTVIECARVAAVLVMLLFPINVFLTYLTFRSFKNSKTQK